MNWIQRLAYLFGALGVICFGIWLMIQINEDAIKSHELPPNTPDAYVENLQLTRLDEKGQIKTRLFAKKAVHYPNTIVDIDLPRGVIYQTDSATETPMNIGLLSMNKPTSQDKSKTPEPPWTIDADHGQLRQKGDVLYLWGHVRVRQAKTNTSQGTELTTTALTYYVKTRKAETDRPVKITQTNGSQITAVGMKADLNTGQVQFLSKMRGRYETN